MILTGIAKEKFLERVNYNDFTFSLLSDLHQNALIIDFFDEQKIIVEVGIHRFHSITFWKSKVNNILYDDLEYKKSRQEATIQAIIKANDLYNERFK